LNRENQEIKMALQKLNLDIQNLAAWVSDKDLLNIKTAVLDAQRQLTQHTGAGSAFHGWVDLPQKSLSALAEILAVAQEIREQATSFISIGIGGSYLGPKATISALCPPFASQHPEIYFAGQSLSSAYLQRLLDHVDWSQTWLNVISKSGTTTEPGITFRILYQRLLAEVGETTARKRVLVTTDATSGALRRQAIQEKWRAFVLPGDVGGRFSVLTPVGLIPIAVAGIDVKSLLRGAQDMAAEISATPFPENSALRYAATRFLLGKRGKQIEILANFEPALHDIGEWWKQLFGESEGKGGKGIFPAAVDLSTDLHSMGQLIQDGPRNLFETFIMLEADPVALRIPESEQNYDGFNFLAGKTLAFVNQKAYEGTAQAHLEGGCPNMTLTLPELSPYYLGKLFYFFEYAVAISGYLLGVNPFDQPGVEAYKNNMFRLLGKPEV
jgi:glucose-6-phosphate isomerase